MQALLSQIPQEIFNFTVYMAIAITMIIGLTRCVLPTRRYAYNFRRATRQLELMVLKEGSNAVWQDPLFLGKPMQRQWKKYLLNLNHVSQRGLQLNVEDYINDDDVFVSGLNMQLSEMLPSLLTSFGILGTFIGLMRGVSGLDVTNAGATMESISKMIGGMTFAYGTSIAGLVCSLIFSMLNRGAQGSATRAMDEFLSTFHDLVMPQSIDDNVQGLCYREDQAIFLRSSLSGLSKDVSEGVRGLADELIKPVTQHMQGFISQAAKEQVEGVHNIVMSFVAQMDRALGGQLSGLASAVNGLLERQNVNVNSLRETVNQINQLMGAMQGVNNGTAKLIELFEGYVGKLARAQDENKRVVMDTANILNSLNSVLAKQNQNMSLMEEGQRRLYAQIEKTENWTRKTLDESSEKASDINKDARDIAKELNLATKRITEGMHYASGSVDESIKDSVKAMEESLKKAIAELSKEMLKLKEQ